eukprot:TRINITY_DN40040_c0_g1_i1.p1 TRINITY_DN40040_c0_g1~~TRINITY_DN40040_c0_g1_i1.p1  ORF type:complete len:175 (+),score=45.98 TRINITY_DN40040_c0_g1_i1:46-525(+)
MAGDAAAAPAAKRRRTASPDADAEAALLKELHSLPGLPPVPAASCPAEVEQQLKAAFGQMERTGDTITKLLRGRRDFGNPDMLANIVRKYDIDQSATLLSPSVWAPPGDANPNGIRSCDFYDEIIKAQAARQQPREESRATVARKSGVAPAALHRGAGK